MIRLLTLIAIALSLAGCGLRPLYSGGSTGSVGSLLSSVEVAPIEGRAGYLVGDALRDRLAANGGAPRYRLDVRLDDSIVGLGVRSDESIARERRTLRARYQLVDLATGQTLVDDTAGSDAGIDVVRSEYAVIAAEQTALERLSVVIADQITARLALFADRTAKTP
ncbi:hypothetical protein GO308_11430 [Sphingomonas sp. SFZ2018-12]|uniref:LPS assembly lipoprotein LptE n=1 Tax=Sphingomonas sp. SFZ2018-12 TaxID=2683197 RepID=UPI001F0DD623|nr:LPS assembly lipoprotein LptE [Sphingomonas sp. SFZ2018-12]MCH4893722.1 hypothetical protein [Sphingomonas sp. SFZ2018-12]